MKNSGDPKVGTKLRYAIICGFYNLNEVLLKKENIKHNI